MKAQSDFRFLIPLLPGQRVALLASNEMLAGTLREENAEVIMWDEQTNGEGTFDHVIVPCLTKAFGEKFPVKCARMLRTGGTLFVGFANSAALERFLPGSESERKQEVAAFTLGRFKKSLHSAGLSPLRTYGIRNLQEPQFVVSLDQPFPGRFFFEQMFYPHSFRAALAQKAANAMAAIGMRGSLFKYFGVVAVKPKGNQSHD